jgi:dolichyl-phosphate-mannose--protein O-mannosyl transferase
VLLIGLAQGSEGDVAAYVASRRFDMRHFSFLYGLVVASMGVASAIGSGLLSLTLSRTGSFDAFLVFSAVATIAGALAFYATGTRQEPES